jgi:hypothetical protein
MRTCRLLFVLSVLVFSVGRAQAQQTLTCSSEDGKRHYCNAETRAGVQMVKQRSGSACTRGYSWDYDDRGIWVDHGCRADFPLSGNAGLDSGGQAITCSSEDGGRHHCSAMTQNGVQMTRQRSGSPCIEGQTWGFDQSGIWVDRGCRADFAVGGNNSYGNGYGNQPGSSRTVRCSSGDGNRNYCNVDTQNARIRMIKQISGSSCVEGSTWGYDSRGIWVDKGCRADFSVETGMAAAMETGADMEMIRRRGERAFRR